MSEQKKIGLNIAVIGGPGAGKSTWIKNYIRGKKAFIYDPNQEYEYDEGGEPTGIVNAYRGPQSPGAFAKGVNKQSRNSVNVFEEATAFLRHGNADEDNLNILTRKRHYRVVNLYVFHALGVLPAWIFPYLDYIVLFNTRDRRDLIEKRYSNQYEVIEAFKKQLKSRRPFQPVISRVS